MCVPGAGLIMSGLSLAKGLFTAKLDADTTRQTNENNNGAAVAQAWTTGQTAASNARADVQKSQGAWGPFGIIGFVLGMVIAFYAAQIVLDSVAWHPVLTTKFYVMPWIEWAYHKPGSWKVAALPPKWEDAVIEIVKALFYVGPPSTAAVIVARALRR